MKSLKYSHVNTKVVDDCDIEDFINNSFPHMKEEFVFESVEFAYKKMLKQYNVVGSLDYYDRQLLEETFETGKYPSNSLSILLNYLCFQNKLDAGLYFIKCNTEE